MKSNTKQVLKFLGPPLAGLLVCSIMLSETQPAKTSLTAMIVIWMAGWWMLEAVHLAVTSLLPLALFPLLGIMDMKDVSANYMEQTIFLFIGGFFLAFAIQKWMLHEWLAAKILHSTGNSPSRILAGVMLTAFFLSMWLSNTATTLLLLAVVISIAHSAKSHTPTGQNPMAIALLLGLTYAATIGGISTLVGTPTNMILPAFCERFLPNSVPISFLNWFRLAFPFATVFAVVAFFVIRHRYLRNSGIHVSLSNSLSTQPLNATQKTVLSIFATTALLWFTRSEINFGLFTMAGWSSLFPYGTLIKDSTVAIFMSLLLFVWPSANGDGTLLEWKDVTRLPLDVIFLFGGGFALSAGVQESGLSSLIGNSVERLNGTPIWMLLLAVMGITTVLSEFASNVASIQLMLPMMLPLAQARGEDPFALLFAATVSASFGYMMPIATAPNTIVFGTGQLHTRDMICTGFWLNVSGIMLLLAWLSLNPF